MAPPEISPLPQIRRPVPLRQSECGFARRDIREAQHVLSALDCENPARRLEHLLLAMGVERLVRGPRRKHRAQSREDARPPAASFVEFRHKRIDAELLRD